MDVPESTKQRDRVRRVMRDGKWRTLQEIQIAMRKLDPTQSISARLRDFRKAKYGGHTVNRRLIERTAAGKTIYEYQLVLRGAPVKK